MVGVTAAGEACAVIRVDVVKGLQHFVGGIFEV
jgi:hypothetical protein